MGAPDVSLVPLEPHGRDLDELSVVSERAFHYDPFFVFLEPREIRRSRFLALFCRSAVGSLGDAVQVTGARQSDGRLVGVAAWIPPGRYPPSLPVQGRQTLGALRAMALRPSTLWKGLRYVAASERAHPKDLLWYLFLLVVDPSVQRAGIGTRLQEPGLEQADKDGLDCYLETQKFDNVAYYRRFGYEVVEELRPVPNGPSLWTMRRATKQ
jgi:ribosomal protein S18 acetylase RimI-like enzyme